jgi:hypothetical protein
MEKSADVLTLFGLLVWIVGLVGCFVRVSQNDGAVAISGALVLAGGLMARAVSVRATINE